MPLFRRSLLLTLIVLVALPGARLAGPRTAPPAADGPNLLANPGFEWPFAKQCCQPDLTEYLPNQPIDEVQVADAWRGWWVEPDKGTAGAHPNACVTVDQNCQPWHRPEFRNANCGGTVCSNRYRSGNDGQKYFTFYSVHDAGMYQQVGGITPGARLRFSIYMHAWTGPGNQGLVSDRNNAMNMRIGIDPTGGTNPHSASVVWTPVRDAYDAWELYTVEATAAANTVTVFTRSAPRYGMVHNDIYLDDASLVVVSAGPVNTNPGGGSNVVPPTAQPTGLRYVVVPGDNYYRVARKFGISVTALLQANPTASPNLLKVGQVLIVPGVPNVPPGTGPVSTAPAPVPTTVAPPANTFAYVVVRGDNLYRLSVRFGTTIARIKQINNLSGDIIFIGQTLLIES